MTASSLTDSSLPTRVLVFDGVCVLCSHWVSFVLRHDRHRLYKFAAMQTASGRELLSRHGLDPDDPTSFLLLEGGRGYMDTDALIRVLGSFGGRWRALAMMVRVLPRFLRDAFYRTIARNRYKLFGRHDVCIVPSEQTAHRFLS